MRKTFIAFRGRLPVGPTTCGRHRSRGGHVLPQVSESRMSSRSLLDRGAIRQHQGAQAAIYPL
jgi:hypothetical protein